MIAGPRHRLRSVGHGVAIAVFILLAWRQVSLVNRYAVNVFYWDQWDFYGPLFRGESWWATFNFQLGPHREGLGLVLMRLLAPWSHWNCRWDAFVSCFAVILAAVLGWRLAVRCGAARGVTLAVVPLLFFNRHQFETFTATANPAHGPLPILLMMAFCLAWFQPAPRRHVLVAILGFFLTYTGFAIFMGALCPFLLTLDTFQLRRRGNRGGAASAAAAVLFMALVWAWFLHDYHFWPPVVGKPFPYPDFRAHVYFVGLLLAHFYGFAHASAPVVALGLLLFAAFLGLAGFHAVRLLRNGVDEAPLALVLFALAAYTLLYVADTALGRVSLGYQVAAIQTRYVTLLVPGNLALFMALSGAHPAHAGRIAGAGFNLALRSTLALGFTLALGLTTVFFTSAERASLDAFHRGRLLWKETYLRTPSEAEANRVSGFQVYPSSQAEKLKFLEEHRLNLFSQS